MPGQSALLHLGGLRRGRLRLIAAGCAAAVAVTAGVVVWAGGDVADSPVRVSGMRGVAVIGTDGTARDVGEGDVLLRGDRVRTDPAGSATLTVEGRRVLVGGDSEVVVPDGASIDLRRGSVLVDRRRGPGLVVDAGDVQVDRIERGALRVERSFNVRLTAYAGGSRVRTGSGRELRLSSLRGVSVVGRTLPNRATPIALRPGDSWEREVIPDVVRADELLTRLALDVDSPTRVGTAGRARNLLGALRSVLAGLAAEAPASEAVLPVAIGRAARGSRDERTRVADARSMRAEGGSWGTVAALADARTGDIASRLDSLLTGTSVPDGPSERPDTTPGEGDTPTPGPGRSPSPSERPTASPSPSPSQSPSPSPSTSSPGLLDQTIGAIESLLPTPRPSVPLPPLP